MSEQLLITGAAPADLLLRDGRIVARGEEATAATARRFDASGLRAAPGFIELQVNGAHGHDLTADPASMWDVAAALPRYGVTSFLPTIVTSPPGTVEAAQRILAAGPPAGHAGARPLGLHVEGPFISPLRHGAHDLALLRETDPGLAWSRDGGVAMVTLAPELPGALDVVRTMVEAGVVVSVGHTNATASQARAGVDAGIRYATHLWNAMPPLHHREPGAVGALLIDDRVTLGLIVDGLHLAPEVVRLAWRAAGPGRISLVSDAMAGLGLPPGRHLLAGTVVIVTERGARTPDGALAGSVIGLDSAVRNLVAQAGCSAHDAIDAVTGVPARLLGLPRPSLDVGAPADIVLLTEGLQVAATIIGGELVHSAEPVPA
ncbi:MAG: N-acetylglucosamine-6-phosphate deacetylase [Chloroflexota bacterium]